MKNPSPCPACGSLEITRNGTHKPTGTQKLVCKSCKRHFRDSYRHKAWTDKVEQRIHSLSWQGLSVRHIAQSLHVSPQTVWQHQQTPHRNCLTIAKRRSREGVNVLETRTPLRYPGGKSKALPQILPHLPDDIQEYREPFLGGASVFFAVRALFGHTLPCWLNDLNPEVAAFWQCLRDNVDVLTSKVMDFRAQYPSGRKLFQVLVCLEPQDSLERAARFFILNRITFSGTTESGGFSESAYQQRFTDTAIAKLREIAPHLQGVRLTQQSYETALQATGAGVFLFLDPPYLTAEKSKLYGQQGNLHTGFDHARFAHEAERSPHRWLITYDDTPQIRHLFRFAQICTGRVQYGMNNYRQNTALKGKELIIKNF